MARCSEQGGQIGRGLAGLVGLSLVFSIAPAAAFLTGVLVPDGRWILPWTLLVVPQLVWCALESSYQPSDTRGDIGQRCRLSVAQGASALGVIFFAVWTATTSDTNLSVARASTMMLGFTLGIALRVRAICGLGNRFRNDIEVSPYHLLETNGIYGKMRHPSELGLMLILGSAATFAGSLVAAAIFLLASLPFTLWRMRCEDRLLLTEHGEAGAFYLKNTPSWSLLSLPHSGQNS